MFFQTERNTKQSKNKKDQIRNIFCNWNSESNYNLSPRDFMDNFRSIQETFFALIRSYGSSDLSAFLGITVQGIKKYNFGSNF